MMTVSGIAAEGLSPNFKSSWIAAESACPQLTAVLGTDTELRFAVIPVMIYVLLIYGAKIDKKTHPVYIFNAKFC